MSVHLEKFVKTLCAVPERTMRTHVLTEKLCALAPESAAQLLQAIITAAAQRRGAYGLVLEALNVPLLTRTAGNAFMSDVYMYAKRSGFEELVRILLRPPASRVCGDMPDQAADEVPSGVRVAMARSGDRQQLARLISDSHPLVIRALLKNPLLTESDVLKICARRPVAADVQREVFHSRRWSGCYRVKKALVLNPYTPTDIGIKIAHVLMEQDLRCVAESRDLHPWLRETARERLHPARTGGGGGCGPEEGGS